MRASPAIATGGKPRWRTWLTWAVVAVAGWYALKLCVGVSLASKMMSCMEGEQVAGASAAQLEASGRRAVECLDGKVNFVERLWYDKDEILVNGKPLADG
jgi:hypothetical protein